MKTNPESVRVSSILKQVRKASHAMAVLPAEEKERALDLFARRIDESRSYLLQENRRDQEQQEGKIPQSLFQRLILDDAKLDQLVNGIRDVGRMADPVGRVLSRTLLDDGLILEKVEVPLGVIGIIFESRPDVIPQILSLILKSGNAVVLKGGSEALHSNRAFMKVVSELSHDLPQLPEYWATLLESREAVHEMLDYPQYIDLIIPRGSSQLVSSIMNATQIPVLGHTEGICHTYVDGAADVAKAVPIVIDSKVQYPAACNALETLLVDQSIAPRFLPALAEAARRNQVSIKGCQQTRRLLPDVTPATEEDWKTEYGNRTMAVKVVKGVDAAIEHINQFGSQHTDSILTQDEATAEYFLDRVDSASVFCNASTRFADGYRYGLGAEIGISTNRTHARGPVGLEGLVIYKYKLRGTGQIVSDYVGQDARPFQHKKLDT
jgi:glutamate-5-semialdehyde dehydrogenase